MKKNPGKYFLLSQVFIFFSISVCILILPDGLFANDGISYFSAHKSTIIPYSLGLLGMAWCSWQFARSLPKGKYKLLERGFKAVAWLLVGVIVIPYTVNFTIEYIHTLLSATVFLLQFMLIWWMVFKIRFDLISISLLLLLGAEMIISVMYLDPRARHLIAGELSFQFTFGLAGYWTAQHIPFRMASKKTLRS